MTSNIHASSPADEPTIDPATALTEIDRVTDRVRAAVRWEAFQWASIAVFITAAGAVQNLNPEHTWSILLGSLAVLTAVLAYLERGKRAVDRGYKRRSRWVWWTMMPLTVIDGGVSAYLITRDMPAVALALAVVPALPPLVACIRLLGR
jgi:hypothetical protein